MVLFPSRILHLTQILHFRHRPLHFRHRSRIFDTDTEFPTQILHFRHRYCISDSDPAFPTRILYFQLRSCISDSDLISNSDPAFPTQVTNKKRNQHSGQFASFHRHAKTSNENKGRQARKSKQRTRARTRATRTIKMKAPVVKNLTLLRCSYREQCGDEDATGSDAGSSECDDADDDRDSFVTCDSDVARDGDSESDDEESRAVPNKQADASE